MPLESNNWVGTSVLTEIGKIPSLIWNVPDTEMRALVIGGYLTFRY